jgi:hypothetical protein
MELVGVGPNVVRDACDARCTVAAQRLDAVREVVADALTALDVENPTRRRRALELLAELIPTHLIRAPLETRHHPTVAAAVRCPSAL